MTNPQPLLRICLLILLVVVASVDAFLVSSSHRATTVRQQPCGPLRRANMNAKGSSVTTSDSTTTSMSRLSSSSSSKTTTAAVTSSTLPTRLLSTLFGACLLCSAMAVDEAHAAPNDYAGDTVEEIISSLQRANGDGNQIFQTYEKLADIITEGTGVGGMVNFKGVQLERGYVADEDTSIYNPGLTLLTETEKERLIDAVIVARKQSIAKGGDQWTENNEFAFEFLKLRLDPLHMVELKGFMGIAPFYGAVVYLAVLAVQQFVRDLFIPAYFIGAAAFFLPIVALVLKGV